MVNKEEFRPCEFDEQHVKGAERYQIQSWVKGYFHTWTGLSEYPRAIVERASDGRIVLVDYKGIRFPKEHGYG